MTAYRITIALTFAVVFASGDAIAQTRENIFSWASPGTTAKKIAEAPAGTSTTTGLPFSLGTLLGLQVALNNPTTYKLNGSGVVVTNHTAGTWDYLGPTATALPSITVVNPSSTQAVAVIVPVGLNSQGGSVNASIGVGVSYGFAVSKGAEVGVAFAMTWANQQSLDDAQKASLSSGKPVAAGESTIGNSLAPYLAFGLYVVPAF